MESSIRQLTLQLPPAAFSTALQCVVSVFHGMKRALRHRSSSSSPVRPSSPLTIPDERSPVRPSSPLTIPDTQRVSRRTRPAMDTAAKRRSPSPVPSGGVPRSSVVSPAPSDTSVHSVPATRSVMSREEQWGTLAHPGYGLRDACRIGDLERVRSQISSGVSVRSIDEAFERTPLHHAAHTGHAAICELLINSGAQVDAVDIGNQTPMHLAAERGHRCDLEPTRGQAAHPQPPTPPFY